MKLETHFLFWPKLKLPTFFEKEKNNYKIYSTATMNVTLQ